MLSSQKGFTLIEVLLYSLFFAFIASLFLGVMFLVINASSSISKKIIIQQESEFVLDKINWAMSGAKDFNASGGQLTINRYNGLPDIVFAPSGLSLAMRIGNGDLSPLNEQDIVISDVSFEKKTTAGAVWLEVRFYLDGEFFSLTKYLKKW